MAKVSDEAIRKFDKAIKAEIRRIINARIQEMIRSGKIKVDQSALDCQPKII